MPQSLGLIKDIRFRLRFGGAVEGVRSRGVDESRSVGIGDQARMPGNWKLGAGSRKLRADSG
jgi:hypothetical protein